MDCASTSAATAQSESGAASSIGALDVPAIEAELTAARERYSHYLLESRLQFRVRGAHFRLLALRDGKFNREHVASADSQKRDDDSGQTSGSSQEVFPELPQVECVPANGDTISGELSRFLLTDGMQFADEDTFVDAPEVIPSCSADSISKV